MNVITNAEMTQIDERAQQEFGMPDLVLMENAGQNAYRLLRSRPGFDDAPRSLLFVAGSGNNGGDALVMARQCCIEGYHRATIVVAKSELKGLAELHCATCRSLGMSVLSYAEQRAEAESAIAAADWIVDGLAGTGIRGALRDSYADMVASINSSCAKVAAVDVPSGIGDAFEPSFPSVRAELTITMELPKIALYTPEARRRCGTILVCPVGFPRTLTHAGGYSGSLLQESELVGFIPQLDDTAYKTKRGVVAVYAGSVGTAGAALLCGRAAAKSGAGMVRLFVDEEIYTVTAAQAQSVMVVPRQSDAAAVTEGYASLLVGPGWGRGKRRFALLRKLVESGIPGVLDADGLNVLADARAREEPVPDFAGRWVLTPHPGECARLTGCSSSEILSRPLESAIQLAGELNAVCVLKGHVTYVAHPDSRFWIYDGMNRAMATGGSGDVLAGVIAALLGQGATAEDAACGGVIAHAVAGSELARRAGWFLAEELVDELGTVLGRTLLGEKR